MLRVLRASLLGTWKVLSSLYHPQGSRSAPLCRVWGSFHISFGCLAGTWEPEHEGLSQEGRTLGE